MYVLYNESLQKFIVIDSNGFIAGLFDTISEAYNYIARINSLWGD